MERLTKKEPCNYTNSDFYSIEMDWHSIYNKLAEFEDFMEEQGFEDLQDLERYIEQSIKAIELLDKKMKENQALKTRWDALHIFARNRQDFNLIELMEKMEELRE